MSDALVPMPQQGGLLSAESQRAVAEVQAGMIIARMNPRDLVRARDLILQDCTRESLAERAVYSYSRGGSEVSGPSIRLAEVMAQRLGNISYGVRELEQRHGESVVQAYAQDMETGTRREMTFTVKHVRDTKRGRINLEDARDIYEMTANQGARRLRACLLGIIPGDITETAVKQCEVTLQTRTPLTPERMQAMVDFFAENGVTRQMIETRIQRRLDALTPALFVQLGKIANSLRDGMSKAADWFDVAPDEAVPSPLRTVPPDIVTAIQESFDQRGWNGAQRTVFLNKYARAEGFDYHAALAELGQIANAGQRTAQPPASPSPEPVKRKPGRPPKATPPPPPPPPAAPVAACEHGTPIDEPCEACIRANAELDAEMSDEAPAPKPGETAEDYAKRRMSEIQDAPGDDKSLPF